MNIFDTLQANPVVAFMLAHLEIWIFLAISIFAIWYFARYFSKKSKPKVISRAELEKQRRIEELKYNDRHIAFKKRIRKFDKEQNIWIETEDTFYPEMQNLWKGSKLLGKIISITPREEAANPTNNIFFEIVFRPSVWFGKWANPFSKQMDVLRFHENELEPIQSEFQRYLAIRKGVSLDAHMGEYYDVPNEEKHKNFINENLWKHDKEANSSFYEVESQKRATFDLNTAAQLDLKEKDIQAELAKKKGFSESV